MPIFRPQLAGEVGYASAAAEIAAAAAADDAAAPARDIFSQRPDLFPPRDALEFYRIFIAQTPNTGIFAPGITMVTPVRLQTLIPAGYRFRVFKFSVARNMGVTHQQAVAGYPNDEIDASISGLNPTELLLDGSPVSGMRRLFDDGGGTSGTNSLAHTVFLRGRGPVTISVRISLNPQSVSYGTTGAWYCGWMWPSQR